MPPLSSLSTGECTIDLVKVSGTAPSACNRARVVCEVVGLQYRVITRETATVWLISIPDSCRDMSLGEEAEIARRVNLGVVGILQYP